MALYIRLSSRCRCARAQYVLAHRETERESAGTFDVFMRKDIKPERNAMWH